MEISELEPQVVWHYFEEICRIPRPSKKEKKMGEYLLAFAVKHHLQASQDAVGSVVIKKEATSDMKDVPTIVLQAHIDMVCEKNSDVNHDFEKDPIEPYVDGGWVRAKGTTLGADDGMGVAAMLAILASTDIHHGALECLFTVDEETGLTGAFALQPGFISGKYLLNLDSEDEGQIFIGCAGGIDTVITLPIERENVIGNGCFAVKITVKGLQGGHSGDDINKGRGNAIKILNRFLWEVNRKYGIQIADYQGGNLRNAIAREAEAVIVFSSQYKESVRVDFNIYLAEMEHIWLMTEPNIRLELESVDMPQNVLIKKDTTQLLNALYACPHGVLTMSQRISGMVETSTNLACVRMEENMVHIPTLQRSDFDSEKMNAAQMVAASFLSVGADVKYCEGYPGWFPNPDSLLLKLVVETYSNLFGRNPEVKTIHAGLECGLFLEKNPGMDMISFGPTLRGVHSPDEKVEIKTVEMWWQHLLNILQNARELCTK